MVQSYKLRNGIVTKLGQLCCDFMFDLHFNKYDVQIREALHDTGKATVWGSIEIAPWQDIHRLLNMQRSVVTAGTDGQAPPAASCRQLRRYASDEGRGDDDAGGDSSGAGGSDGVRADLLRERADAWRQATMSRRKCVTIGVAKAQSESTLQAQFQSSGAIYHAQGRAGSAHRVFLLSADLLSERSSRPWANLSDLTSAADNIINFMLAQTGPHDVVVFCDGRSRASRLHIESLTTKMRHPSELFIIYKPTNRLAAHGSAPHHQFSKVGRQFAGN